MPKGSKSERDLVLHFHPSLCVGPPLSLPIHDTLLITTWRSPKTNGQTSCSLLQLRPRFIGVGGSPVQWFLPACPGALYFYLRSGRLELGEVGKDVSLLGTTVSVSGTLVDGHLGRPPVTPIVVDVVVHSVRHWPLSSTQGL